MTGHSDEEVSALETIQELAQASTAAEECAECAECGETREHHGPIPFVPKPPDDYSNPEEWET